MRYVLTEPTGIRILQMTRPIEKVERRSNLQVGVLIWDIFNILFFIAMGIFRQNLKLKNPDAYHILEAGYIICNFFFLATVIFYVLTLMDPGYVDKQPNFQEILQKIQAESYHLDYVCVHCENLRPENAEHCNFCNRCV